MEYAKLRGAIREKYGTESRFAIALGITQQTLSRKLSRETDWKLDEVRKACYLLDIPASTVCDYFFATKVSV